MCKICTEGIKQMNIYLKTKLINVLRAEAREILNSKAGEVERKERMNEIESMMKVVNNFAEIEPVVIRFLEEKHERSKYYE